MRNPQLAQAHANLTAACELVAEADLYFNCPELKRRALLATLGALADVVDVQTAPASKSKTGEFVLEVPRGIAEQTRRAS